MIKVLIQTTIPTITDDWHAGRFSMLRDHLRSLTGTDGAPLYDVVARDRAAPAGDDPVLSTLDTSDFDQLWLFALDTGNGLTPAECAAIGRFRERGGGVFTARDHQDLGSSLCSLGGLGLAHHFHSQNPSADEDHRTIDDEATTTISWPNFHSGNNGDLQTIVPVEPVHDLLRGEGKTLTRFPAHPHEGDVSAPPADPSARVIAHGKTKRGRTFNIAVAFDGSDGKGRGLAESTFHHFVDYNWDINAGCPSFLSETPGHAIEGDPHALDDIKAYVANVAAWLSPPSTRA